MAVQRFKVLAVCAASLVVGACAQNGSSGAEESGQSASESDGSSGSGTSAPTTTGASTTSGDTTGTSSTTSGTGGTDTAGSGFVAEPDVPGPAMMCDVLAQDCAEDEKCTPASLDGDGIPEATICRSVDPNPASAGDDCMWEGALFSGVDNCERGTWCFPASTEDVTGNTGIGYCQQLCQGTPAAPTCPEPNQVCEVANDGVLPWCLERCNPLLVECPEGQACYPHSDGTFACKLMNPGAYGEPCTLQNQCNPGLVCATAAAVPGCADQGAAACCSEYCDLTSADGDAQCMGQADGQICTPAYGDMEPPPGYENVGICLIPM